MFWLINANKQIGIYRNTKVHKMHPKKCVGSLRYVSDNKCRKKRKLKLKQQKKETKNKNKK